MFSLMKKPSSAHDGRLKPVPIGTLRRLRAAAVIVYGLDLALIGALVSGLAFSGRESLALAIAAGHGVALIIGASWVWGSLMAANTTVSRLFASTMLLSPLRYAFGALALVGIGSALPSQTDTAAMLCAFALTQVPNHVLHAVISKYLSDARR